MTNTLTVACSRRRLWIAAAVVALPVIVMPWSVGLSAALGVAATHGWFYNLPAHRAAQPAEAPATVVVAATGLGWLVAGLMLLAQMR
jgi:hypothetical protein